MLKEIEDKLVKVLREKLTDVPKENIVVGIEPSRLPAVVISSLEFTLEKADMAENLDSGDIDLEEKLSPNGVETVFKLKEEPLRNSLHVEYPIGEQLTEKSDYSVDYARFSIKMRKAPTKGKNILKINYKSRNRVLTLKKLKVKALYSVDILGRDGTEADSLAEKVIKTLLEEEDKLIDEEIEIKPVGGTTSFQEKNVKTRLNYKVERLMRLEQIIGPIEKIEITRKNK